jgi:hypothetical protein
MEYEEGSSLEELPKWREGEGRPLEEADVVNLLRPLLEGLKAVHSQVGVAPGHQLPAGNRKDRFPGARQPQDGV